jgi:saccharopine dehydrogenase-like NADP-dependent oxidoreductase
MVKDSFIQNVTDKPVVGLIGGYGSVGSVIAKQLSEQGSVKLIIAGRNKDKIDALVSTFHQSIEGRVVNIDDSKALSFFCRDCDIVVNCTGPSTLVKDKVISQAASAGCHYVDPGIWHDAHGKYDKIMKEKHRIGLLFCGFIPGLTGILPRFLYKQSKSFFDVYEGMEIYCGDRSSWSEHACMDILHYFIRGVPTGSYKNGRFNEKPFIFSFLNARKHKYPYGLGKFLVSPMYSNELDRLAAEMHIPSLSFYVGIFGWVALMKLLFIRILPIRDQTAIGILRKVLQREQKIHGSGGVIECKILGRKNNKTKICSVSLHDNDTVTLTGICTALAVDFLIKKQIRESGVNLLCNCIDPVLFIERLVKYGLNLDLNVLEN